MFTANFGVAFIRACDGSGRILLTVLFDLGRWRMTSSSSVSPEMLSSVFRRQHSKIPSHRHCRNNERPTAGEHCRLIKLNVSQSASTAWREMPVSHSPERRERYSLCSRICSRHPMSSNPIQTPLHLHHHHITDCSLPMQADVYLLR